MEEAKYWNKVSRQWKEPVRLWRKYSDTVYTMLLKRWLPSDRVTMLLKTDLFDEASSNGLYLQLTQRANNLIGIDISDNIIHTAKSRYPHLKAINADVRYLPFPDNKFDVIISNSTLDHFKSLDEIYNALIELRRILKPEGQLILTLDNPINPVIALRNSIPFNLLKRLNIVPYYVGVTLSPIHLKRVLKRVGFAVGEITTIMHFPRIFITLTNRLESLHFLTAFERLSNWPTRFLTGYFVAVKAIKS